MCECSWRLWASSICPYLSVNIIVTMYSRLLQRHRVHAPYVISNNIRSLLRFWTTATFLCAGPGCLPYCRELSYKSDLFPKLLEVAGWRLTYQTQKLDKWFPVKYSTFSEAFAGFNEPWFTVLQKLAYLFPHSPHFPFVTDGHSWDLLHKIRYPF